MGVSSIQIVNQAGETVVNAGDELYLRVEDGAAAMFSQAGQSTVLWDMSTTPPDIYRQALAELKQQGWVKTIHGVAPKDGQFQIQGGTCFSWIPGDKAVHTYKQDIGTPEAPHVVYITEPRGGGMKMFDMCQACDTCSRTATLRHRLEALKIKLNTLKDKNLYNAADLNARLGYLRGERAGMPAACGVPQESYLAVAESGTRTLGQFATCVHMWNYLAARSHYKTTVECAPQDPAAILVKTSHAYPTCSSTQGVPGGTIQCTVDIRRNNSPSTTADDISVYVPTPSTGFRPFTDSNVTSSMATVTQDSTDATHKTITTTFPGVTKAGTYTLGLYVMPFHCAELRDSSNNKLSLDNINYALSPTWGYETSSEDGLRYRTATFATQATLTNLRKTSPTTADYDGSKTFPSKSDTGTYAWAVTVTWSLTGLIGADPTVPSTSVESFIIEARKPRKPVDGLFTVTKLREVAPQ